MFFRNGSKLPVLILTRISINNKLCCSTGVPSSFYFFKFIFKMCVRYAYKRITNKGRVKRYILELKNKNKIKSRDKCLQRKRCASGPHARAAVKHSKSHVLQNVYNFTVPRKGFLLQPFGMLNTRNTRTVMIYILFGFSHPVIFTLNRPLRGMFSLYT